MLLSVTTNINYCTEPARQVSTATQPSPAEKKHNFNCLTSRTVRSIGTDELGAGIAEEECWVFLRPHEVHTLG